MNKDIRKKTQRRNNKLWLTQRRSRCFIRLWRLTLFCAYIPSESWEDGHGSMALLPDTPL